MVLEERNPVRIYCVAVTRTVTPGAVGATTTAGFLVMGPEDDLPNPIQPTFELRYPGTAVPFLLGEAYRLVLAKDAGE